MGQTNVWMDWFKLHDDLQNEIHFPFKYVTQGREIHHKQCKALFVFSTHRTAAR